MRHPQSLLRLVAALTLAAASAAGAQTPATRPSRRPAAPVTLRVGDAAPPLRVERWLKGTPVTSLADGKVHVVEFWATWCGWCIQGMPHLSELARKYGERVPIVSVNVWEAKYDAQAAGGFHGVDPRVDKRGRVEAFVRRAGDMMAYNVAADGEAGTMATTWCRAAGIRGIPAAVVVDGGGRIAWIGNPTTGMEQVIDALLQGKYDAATARAIDAEWAANEAEYPALTTRLKQLFQDGSYAQALSVDDRLLAVNPSGDAQWYAARYAILTHTDPAAAAALGRDVLARHADAPSLLSGLGISIVDDRRDFATAGRPDYPLAIRLLNQSGVCMELRWPAEQAMATACFNTGDAAGAVRWQSEAVAKMDALLSKVPTSAPYRDDSHRRLDKYRAAAATAASAN